MTNPETLRQQAIEQGAKALSEVVIVGRNGERGTLRSLIEGICSLAGMEWDESAYHESTVTLSTAAFDAHLSAIVEPDDAMIRAGELVAVADFVPAGQFEAMTWKAMILKLSETAK